MSVPPGESRGEPEQDGLVGWFRPEPAASSYDGSHPATTEFDLTPVRRPRRRGRRLLVLGAGASLGGLLAWSAFAPTALPHRGPTDTGAQAAPARSFTLAASGDVLLHEGTRLEAARQARLAGKGANFDFLPLLAQVAPIVSAADLAICHEEVPLSAPGGPYTGYPLFSGPPEAATALAEAGYDSCSTASNHTLDKGLAGIATTFEAFDAAGIKHTGSARTVEEAQTPLLLDAKGVKVAQLSYTFGFNGIPVPTNAPWSANKIDADAILGAAAAARVAGAEVVVLSLHWGNEYQHEVTPEQRSLAQRLLASPDVDLILGHHAHVVQPMEKYEGKWVAYGMGNLIAAKSHDFADGATREGMLPTFTFVEDTPGRFTVSAVEVSPLYISTVPSLHVADIATALPGAEAARMRRASERTKAWVLSDPSASEGVER